MNSDPDSQSMIAQILLLVLLTMINAFLSAAEIAVVSTNRNRVEQKAEDGDKSSQKLLEILNEPTNFLSTIQVGITLVNILSGASLADSFASRLAPLIGTSAAARSIATFIVLAILTYVSIVFGELYPKRIAMNKSEEIARYTSGVIQFLGVLTKPFVWLLSASTNLLSRITPITFDDADSKMTRDEMRYMLASEGILEEDELEMLQGIFSLDTKVAREVMVPRTDAFMVDIQGDVQTILNKILSENYSRIPVYNEDKDKIIGVLHTKTLLKAAYDVGFENLNFMEVMQEPLFVPETVFIDDLLYELKKTQNQMAILLDEYGGVVGIVTLEDLLEEIVGEIDDESDEVSTLYEVISDHEYIVQGKMLITEFNSEFGTKIDMPDVDTMAGYLITALGTIPEPDEKLTFDVENMTLEPFEIEGSRVIKIRVMFHDNQEEEKEPEEEKRFFRKDSDEDESKK